MTSSNYTAEVTDDVIALLRSRMEVVVPEALDAPVCRDPDDDNILATAVSGNGQCIITGDKDLLVLKRFQRIDILAPNAFLAYEEAD